MTKTVFLIDADQISSLGAKRWATIGSLEIFGCSSAVKAWKKACAAYGIALTATVALTHREAADVDMVLRAGQLMTLPAGHRPKRVFLISCDRRFKALTHRLAEVGIYAVASPDPDTDIDDSKEFFENHLACRVIRGMVEHGPVKASDIGATLKAQGLKPCGKLTDFARWAGFLVYVDNNDGFFWICMAPESEEPA